MSAPDTWLTHLGEVTKTKDDGTFILEWYKRSQDRTRNPFQLRGFNDNTRKIVTFLNETLLNLRVPPEDIDRFLANFRNYLADNEELNRSEDPLPQILEFYYKSGDYFILDTNTFQSMFDLFCGQYKPEGGPKGKPLDFEFSDFSAHFGDLQAVFSKIAFDNYFYMGLDKRAPYQIFRRTDSIAFVRDEILRDEKTGNITPYAFMKEINTIFSERRTKDLMEAKGLYEVNKDKEKIQFMYKLEVERLYIEIILAMSKHLQNYFQRGYYIDVTGKMDNLLVVSNSLLSTLIGPHMTVNNMLNPSTFIDGFNRVYEYIQTFGSENLKLEGLINFYMKLRLVRSEENIPDIGTFWDMFDSVEDDSLSNEMILGRSYKYRGDFDPSNQLVEDVPIDPVIIEEIDDAIKAKKIPFSAVVQAFSKKEFLMYTFFKHLRDAFGYDLRLSFSKNRDILIKTCEAQERAYNEGQPIPPADLYEAQWADEVPLPIDIDTIGSESDYAEKVAHFIALLSRFEGKAEVKQFLFKLNNKNASRSMILNTAKTELGQLMSEYAQLRRSLVTYIGSYRPGPFVDGYNFIAVDLDDTAIHLLVEADGKYSTIRLENDNLKTQPTASGGVQLVLEPLFPDTFDSDKGIEDDERKLSLYSSAGIEQYLDEGQRLVNPTIPDRVVPIFFKKADGIYVKNFDEQLLYIANDTVTALFPAVKKDATIPNKKLARFFASRKGESIYTFLVGNPSSANSSMFQADFSMPNDGESATFTTIDETIYFEDIVITYQENFVSIDKTIGEDPVITYISPNNLTFEKLNVLKDHRGFKLVADPEADIFYIISSLNGVTHIHKFVFGQALLPILKIPTIGIKSIVYQKKQNRFVFISDSNLIYFVNLLEVPIPKPRVQPDLPEDDNDLDAWFEKVNGDPKDVLAEYIRALNEVRDIFDVQGNSENYDKLVNLLNLGVRPSEYKNIFIPILKELFRIHKLVYPKPAGRVNPAGLAAAGMPPPSPPSPPPGPPPPPPPARGNKAAFVMRGGGMVGGGSRRMKELTSLFINASSRNTQTKENLQTVAKQTSTNYKSLIRHQEPSTKPLLLDKVFGKHV